MSELASESSIFRTSPSLWLAPVEWSLRSVPVFAAGEGTS